MLASMLPVQFGNNCVVGPSLSANSVSVKRSIIGQWSMRVRAAVCTGAGTMRCV